MQALILAAGMGKRLGKYTRECTKCMVEVNGIMLIERMIDALRFAGISKLVTVVGYKGDELKKHIQDIAKDMELVFVENDNYQQTNNIYSLYLAREQLAKDDTILMESDLIFDRQIIERIIQDPANNTVTVAKYEHWMDGTVVLLDEEQTVLDFVEKADFRFENADLYYKTVNIYKFSRQFSEQQYIPFLEAYIQAYGVNQYYELVLKILAHVHNSQLKAIDISEYSWYEIDDVQDLRIAETIFAAEDKQFHAYDNHYGGFWRFPKLNDFCYLVNPYYPPQKMMDHMKYFYDTLLRNYPSGISTQNLNAARMFQVDEKYILVGNGAAELIDAVGKMVSGNMLTVIPTFNEYKRCFFNCNIVELNGSELDFRVTADDVIKRLDGVDKVALINPDNPTGNFLEQNELLKIVETCEQKNILCIVDESFVDFADPEKRFTLLRDQILEKYPHLLVIKSISKSYGVPGLRLGIAATANVDFLDNMRRSLPIWNINSLAEYFLQIHGLYSEDYSAACDKIAEQRKIMIKELDQLPGLRVYPSQANYIMCHLNGKTNAEELSNKLVKKYNILIKDLSTKDGIPDRDFVRVAVKSRWENGMLVAAIRDIME